MNGNNSRSSRKTIDKKEYLNHSSGSQKQYKATLIWTVYRNGINETYTYNTHV